MQLLIEKSGSTTKTIVTMFQELQPLSNFLFNCSHFNVFLSPIQNFTKNWQMIFWLPKKNTFQNHLNEIFSASRPPENTSDPKVGPNTKTYAKNKSTASHTRIKKTKIKTCNGLLIK